MENVRKTLYIPLYGKACVSRKRILLHDAKAEAIWAAEGFPLKGKSASKWLAYYMGMRAAVFDRWVRVKMEVEPEAVVLQLGCGMDSRAERVGTAGYLWFDVDFPEVIAERKRYFPETPRYCMIASDIRDLTWLESIPCGKAIVVMEGVSMYLRREELEAVLAGLNAHFDGVQLLMDCYTEFAAKASRYKNPINDVGVHQVYGLDAPEMLKGLPFVREHDMTPEDLICQLGRGERLLFRRLYAGGIARNVYRLYEYGTM